MEDKTTDKIMDELSIKTIEDLKVFFEGFQKKMSYYKCALYEVETKFKVLNEQFALLHERNPIETIKTRIKSIESIREKIIRKNLINSSDKEIEDKLHDIAGIKIICPFVDDIYMLAECLRKQDDVWVLKEKDYIKNPKPNGYRSYHMIIEIPIFLQNEKRFVKVEVQLRTIAMECWANLEHRIRYKKNLPCELLSKVSEDLLKCAELTEKLDFEMQEIKNEVE